MRIRRHRGRVPGVRPVLTVIASALVAACVALAAFVPAASAMITAAPEPVFTKTAGNNHFYFTVEKPTFYTEYRACIVTTQVVPGGEQILEGAFGGPGVSGSLCTANLPAGTKSFNEVVFDASWIPPSGNTYRVCLAAYHNTAGVIWQTEPQANGQYVICPTSTIDRSKPTTSVHLAGDAPVVNTATVPVRIDYQDSISPPWQGPNGTASNWVCAAAYPTQCSPNQISSVCSVPTIPNDMGHYPANLSDSFSCTLNVPGEGRYVVCSTSADSAVPDDPVNPWNGTANSANANLSAAACDDVTVDTTGPAVTVSADAVDVTVGRLVSFGAGASDPAGTSGSYDWDFGDNTPHGSGPAPTHTFTQPGTFVVRAVTTDGAGNSGSGTVTVTVKAPDGGGGGGGGTGTGGGPGTGTGTGGSTGPGGGGGKGGSGTGPGGGKSTGGDGGGAALPGTGAGTFTPAGSPALTTAEVKATGALTAIAPLAASALGKANGGGTRSATVGKLKITAPSSFTAGRTRLKLTATFGQPGSLEVTLLKGKRPIARGKLLATQPGTAGVALKVPKQLPPGAYQLTVTYRPSSGKPLTKQLGLTVRGKAA